MPLPSDNPFHSFWMTGYEGADHVNDRRQPLDMCASNGHDRSVVDDYRRAFRLGLRTVRESIGWRLTENRQGRRDLGRALAFQRAARQEGLQIVWTLMHYGAPDGLRIDDASFVERFADFAGHVARTLRGGGDSAPVFNPINEIGFLAWAVSQTGMMHPYDNHDPEAGLKHGFEIKRILAQAELRAMQAMRAEDASCRFLHIDPMVNVVHPAGRPELADLAMRIRDYQWQTFDLLTGRLEPELGGSPESLDIMGLNFYASGQWEVMTDHRVCWHLADARWLPLDRLVERAWERYRRPFIVAETGHVGEGRAAWIHDVAASAERLLGRGLPLLGMCLYPGIDRHDWSDITHWHHSGLWDVEVGNGFERRLHRPAAKVLRRWQQRLSTFKEMTA